MVHETLKWTPMQNIANVERIMHHDPFTYELISEYYRENVDFWDGFNN
jgi:hypothetical protein